MPFATVPNSSYLDLFGHRITDKTTVETAYNISPTHVGNPTYGLDVALVLPRANQPTFLAEDWATRQQTIAQYNSTNSLWSTFGADKQQFDFVKQQVKDLGLTVIESTDTASGNYVTSAELADHLGEDRHGRRLHQAVLGSGAAATVDQSGRFERQVPVLEWPALAADGMEHRRPLV